MEPTLVEDLAGTGFLPNTGFLPYSLLAYDTNVYPPQPQVLPVLSLPVIPQTTPTEGSIQPNTSQTSSPNAHQSKVPMFTPAQRFVLWSYFSEHFTQPYPRDVDQMQLSTQGNMSPRTVLCWFGNHRRSLRDELDTQMSHIQSLPAEQAAWVRAVHAIAVLLWTNAGARSSSQFAPRQSRHPTEFRSRQDIQRQVEYCLQLARNADRTEQPLPQATAAVTGLDQSWFSFTDFSTPRSDQQPSAVDDLFSFTFCRDQYK